VNYTCIHVCHGQTQMHTCKCHVHMHVCMPGTLAYVYMSCTHTCIWLNSHIHIHACMSIRKYFYMYMFTNMYMHIGMYMYTYMYLYIYIYIYVRIYTQTHAHIYNSVWYHYPGQWTIAVLHVCVVCSYTTSHSNKIPVNYTKLNPQKDRIHTQPTARVCKCVNMHTRA